MGKPRAVSGPTAASLVWPGSVDTTIAGNTLFGEHAFRLRHVQNGNHLLTWLAMGAVIGWMG